MANNNFTKTRVTGLFEGGFGYSVKVTQEIIDRLQGLKVGDYLQMNAAKQEWLDENPNTAPFTLVISSPNGGQASAGSPAPRQEAAPAPQAQFKPRARAQKFT